MQRFQLFTSYTIGNRNARKNPSSRGQPWRKRTGPASRLGVRLALEEHPIHQIALLAHHAMHWFSNFGVHLVEHLPAFVPESKGGSGGV
jgi:hypothetical protein